MHSNDTEGLLLKLKLQFYAWVILSLEVQWFQLNGHLQCEAHKISDMIESNSKVLTRTTFANMTQNSFSVFREVDASNTRHSTY